MIPSVHLFKNIEKIFSLNENGLLIRDLDYSWRKNSLSSLLVLEIKDLILGVYFDRELKLIENSVNNSESLLFIFKEDLETFKHSDQKMLEYKFVNNQGIFIGNSS